MRVTAGACAAILGLLMLGGARAAEDPVTIELEVVGIGQEVTSSSDAASPAGGEDSAGTVSARFALGADFGNGLSAVFAVEGWEGDGFDQAEDLRTLVPVNGDIALRSSRALTEGYFTVQPEGVATSDALLLDERGRIGRALQTLLISAR